MGDKLALKHWRQLRNLTQAELAEKVRISPKTIYAYETDLSALKKASFENIERIAQALEISIDQIKFF